MDIKQQPAFETVSEEKLSLEEFVVPSQYRARFSTVSSPYSNNLVRVGLQTRTHVRAGGSPIPGLR